MSIFVLPFHISLDRCPLVCVFHVIAGQVSLADAVGVEQSGDKTAEDLINRYAVSLSAFISLPLARIANCKHRPSN